MGASSRIASLQSFCAGAKPAAFDPHVFFIFLLHPYSNPAITKIRRVQTGREVKLRVDTPKDKENKYERTRHSEMVQWG
jgi:hypothetical protein